jgi:hypothetical protein
VRDHVNHGQWNQLRRQTYQQTHDHCEICGGQGPEWPVACHEVWHDDDTTYKQILGQLIAFCPACHRTKHMGLAEVKDSLAEARFPLAQVNGWPEAQANTYLVQVWTVWEERSAHSWRLNLSWLERGQIFVPPKR